MNIEQELEKFLSNKLGEAGSMSATEKYLLTIGFLAGYRTSNTHALNKVNELLEVA